MVADTQASAENGTHDATARPPTALSEWLRLTNTTANKLATVAAVYPRSVYALARGNTELVKPSTLIAISNHTGLTIDDLIRPYHAARIATDTGHHKINLVLATMAKYLHTPQCKQKLARYIHSDFRCHGTWYQHLDENAPALSFTQMCAANAVVEHSIFCVVLSAHWYTPRGCPSKQAHVLHSYWKAVVSDNTARTTTDTTFIVLEFQKSIAEMDAFEDPQVTSWWWHRPSELTMDLSDQRVDNLETMHQKIRDAQFAEIK